MTCQKRTTTEIRGIGAFKIRKLDDGPSSICFVGSPDEPRMIDAMGTIHKNIHNKIQTASRQLREFTREKEARRILLLAGGYPHAEGVSDYIDGLSNSLQMLRRSGDIDEIWLQLRREEKRFDHYLLYKRTFFEGLERGQVETTAENAGLFHV